MPTDADAGRVVLVDTSVAVPLVVADHQHHSEVVDALAGRELGLAGHAAFETHSVLTRLPPPARRTPPAIARLLTARFPATRMLSENGAAALLEELGALGLAGGSVYDALIGAAAREHGAILASRDRRGLDTYRALGVQVLLLA